MLKTTSVIFVAAGVKPLKKRVCVVTVQQTANLKGVSQTTHCTSVKDVLQIFFHTATISRSKDNKSTTILQKSRKFVCSQLLKCEILLFFYVMYERKCSFFRFYTVGWTKRAI